jgi:glutathione synthase/RimK-type ligase-like ATP-grasp enzyme
MAQSVGFKIPKTVVTNDWADVMALPADELTLKSVGGLFSSKGSTSILYSQRLKNDPNCLPLQTSPYPGIWQPHLPKKREWRITFVGDQTFDTAIYMTEEAKNDWRQHQGDQKAVQFKAEPFPAKLKERCREYLRRYKLRFGVLEFIETPEGEIIFLELNTNGQYGWLEDRLGFPISSAIASELAAIATRSKR